MATEDKRLFELDAVAAVSGPELLFVDDPDGANEAKKITVDNFKDSVLEVIQEEVDGKIAKTTDVTAINDTGIADGEIAEFNKTSKDIRTSNKVFSTDGTLAGNSDSNVPTEKAVKTYADTKAVKTVFETEHNADGTHGATTHTSVSTDTLSEKTVGAGIAVDGVQCKDGIANSAQMSGTYTPTLTNSSNVSASTAFPMSWSRIGNVMTVSFKATIDPDLSAPTATTLLFTLPVACATTPTIAWGTGGDGTYGQNGIMAAADATKAGYYFPATSGNSITHYGIFQYVVN